MANAQAFISAGGRAHWEMLVFEHNQHQVDQAQAMARDMGFKWFRAKVSKRFKTHPVEFLTPPIGWQDPIVSEGEIECQAIKESSLYISAKGTVYPCCWMGTSENSMDKFDSIQKSWASGRPNDICATTCIKNAVGTSFTNQWQRSIEFQFTS